MTVFMGKRIPQLLKKTIRSLVQRGMSLNG